MELTKPGDVFGRDREWMDLSRFALSSGPGLQIGIVYGRRRQGKSFLLRRLSAATDGFYFQALEEEKRPALDRFGVALAGDLSLPGGRLRFTDWAEAVDALVGLQAERASRRRKVIVLDEFPYLLAHSPELPSVLQRAVDGSRAAAGPPRRLLICGSSLSVMTRLLTGAQALRGRVSMELLLRPFNYRETGAFWGVEDVDVAFQLHAILGGTPGYRDLLTTRPPRSARGLGRWLATGVLNPASALFREDEYLLAEDESVTDRAAYHSVLGAVAAGCTSESKIAASLGRDQRSVQHQLRTLERAGFVVKEQDVLRRRRPLYRLADPIVRFHHVVKRPDLPSFEEHRAIEVWQSAAPRYLSGVLGPHFEEIAREFVRRYAAKATVGGRIGIVGPAVINDPAGRAQHQLDVVALGSRGQVRLIGEANYSARKLTRASLDRLAQIRELLEGRGLEVENAKLALFSASGFDSRLATTPPTNSELVDLNRLYLGE